MVHDCISALDDSTSFCAGETRAKTFDALCHPRERRIVMPLEVFPEHNLAFVDANLLADMLGDQLIVPGEDFYSGRRRGEGVQSTRRHPR